MMANDLCAIEVHLANRLDPSAGQTKRIAGIVGERPSQYAKSPSLWNAVFRALDLNAVYFPFDVGESNLGALVRILRETDRLLGFSVTVPYKVKIIEHLDGLDQKALQIGAVNTVVRTENGRLIGYNTDGCGFLRSVTLSPFPGDEPLLRDLEGMNVLIIGAGGAARAVAFYLAEAITTGRLFVANRTVSTAVSLAEEINKTYGNACPIDEKEIAGTASAVGLVVNCSTKGQSGVQKLSGDDAVILEPYSALAPASPAAFPADSTRDGKEFYRKWFEASQADIEQNNQISATVAISAPLSVVAYDLVYAPLETVFLRHFRLTGHHTANGKSMNIAQAADAFFDKVCHPYLHRLGLDTPETYSRIVRVMCDVW